MDSCMIKFSAIQKYKGMFQKCFMEPTIHGFSVFDTNNDFIGEILNEGFSINSEYEHSEMITRELVKKGINVFDFDTHEEIKHEQEINDLLYGD